MKLVRLYSNRPAIFPAIQFRNGLNVVLASVKQAHDLDRDDHNLGKTLLVRLIDFMLLKEIDKTFFLREHPDRFEGFEFLLEIVLPDGVSHLTIRRCSDADTKIAFKRHGPNDSESPYADVADQEWDHFNVPIKKAVQLLEGYLAFDALPEADYRKGVSYFLRTQHDYRDPFRIEKFLHSKDIDWKPYVADVLGLPGDLVRKKYLADRDAEHGEAAAKMLEENLPVTEDDYDRVKAHIERMESDLRTRQSQLGAFSFHDMEMEISEALVQEVDSGIGRTERELYYQNRDLQVTQDALARPLEFRAAEVEEVYRECSLALPELLVRSYQELETFNRKLAKERNKYLKQKVASLEAAISKLKTDHQEFSNRRQRYLEILRNKESLERFKRLQVETIHVEQELEQIKRQLERLDEISGLRSRGRSAKREAEELSDQLKQQAVHHPPARYESIRSRFRSIVDECLKVPAVLYVKLNDEGNLEFKAEIERRAGSGEISSEADGSTYAKILCMAFDLAVLAEYSKKRFFHFVYHDGALEGEDDRKKLRMLEIVRRYCDEFGIQYILSAIQHELPRTPSGTVIEFAKEEIVRELHDDGDAGRLFRMPAF